MRAVVLSTNFRNADNWLALFQLLIRGGHECHALWLPWQGDASAARMTELPLPVRAVHPIERLDEHGMPLAALRALLDEHVDAGIDVVFLCDMQSYPSTAVHALLRERPQPPRVIGLQHGLFQSWWLYNRHFCADQLLCFGARHVRELAAELRHRAWPVGLPKLDALAGQGMQDGGYVLCLAQRVPEATAVSALLADLELAGGLPIVVRNHPQYPGLVVAPSALPPPVVNGRPVGDLPYHEQLAHASWVLTPHSTGGIEALHLGKPVVLLPNHGLTAWAGYPAVATDLSAGAVLAALARARECRGEVLAFLDDTFGGLRFDGAQRAAQAVRRIVEHGDADESTGFARFESRRHGLRRRDDVVELVTHGGIGIELGVAEGVLSERLLRRQVLAHLYSVDMYAGDRGHDNGQYKRALRRLAPFRSHNTLIKLRFDEALDLFPDAHFDFIYVDGYAHTGEESGATFLDWYPKLKPGGVMAGDDYCAEWPLVMQAVDGFVAAHGLRLHVIDCREDEAYCKYPTWYARKPD